MSEEEATLMAIRGAIYSMPAGQRSEIERVIDALKAVLLRERSDYGALAIALIGAELAAAG